MAGPIPIRSKDKFLDYLDEIKEKYASGEILSVAVITYSKDEVAEWVWTHSWPLIRLLGALERLKHGIHLELDNDHQEWEL